MELAARLKLKQASPVAPLAPRRTDFQVGHEQRFTVLDLDERRPFTIDAVLRKVTPHTYLYVQKGQPVSDDDLERSAREVEERIIPEVRRLANPAWDPGAGLDSRVAILHGQVPGVAGYYSFTDLLPKAVNRLSNERPVTYINLEVLRPGTPSYYAVLAHEFQHSAQTQLDAFEETWLQEGASEYVAQAGGYPVGLFLSFLARPDTQLTAWPDVSASTPPHYGAANLFFSYLSRRFGAEAVRELIGSPLHGVASVDAFAQKHGVAGGFDQLFADWTVATYRDPTGGPLLLPGGQSGRPALAASVDRPGDFSGTVRQYAAHYIRLRPQPAPLHLEFQGPTLAPLVPIQPASGAFFWYSNRGDSVDSSLTRVFDLSGVSRATLNFRLWFDIESEFDFAYVEASRDGKTWDVLPGRHTTTSDPLDQSFGPAYTGKSGGGATAAWVDESVDLSAYAGGRVWVRFEYITDQAVNNNGLVIDDLSVPEIGVVDDAESPGAWDSRGFVRTNNLTPQRFSVRIIETGDQGAVREVPLDSANHGEALLRPNAEVVLVVAAMAPVTTTPASYSYSLTPVP